VRDEISSIVGASLGVRLSPWKPHPVVTGPADADRASLGNRAGEREAPARLNQTNVSRTPQPGSFSSPRSNLFRKIAFSIDSCASTIEEFTLCAGIGLAIIRACVLGSVRRAL